MANPLQSTPFSNSSNPQRMNPEISAVFAVPELNASVMHRSRIQTSEKKEYLAKTPEEILELLHIQYLQTEHLKLKEEDDRRKAEQRMAKIVSALMEKNYSITVELMQDYRDIFTLKNKIVLDEQLDIQTQSVKDLENLATTIDELKNLADVLDSQRHVLKLHKIVPQSDDVLPILKDIDGLVTQLSNKMAGFMQPAVLASATSKIADGTKCLEDCNDLSVKVEGLAIEEMGFDIHRLI